LVQKIGHVVQIRLTLIVEREKGFRRFPEEEPLAPADLFTGKIETGEHPQGDPCPNQAPPWVSPKVLEGHSGRGDARQQDQRGAPFEHTARIDVPAQHDLADVRPVEEVGREHHQGRQRRKIEP